MKMIKESSNKKKRMLAISLCVVILFVAMGVLILKSAKPVYAMSIDTIIRIEAYRDLSVNKEVQGELSSLQFEPVTDWGMGIAERVLDTYGVDISESRRDIIRINMMQLLNKISGYNFIEFDETGLEITELTKSYVSNAVADAVLSEFPNVSGISVESKDTGVVSNLLGEDKDLNTLKTSANEIKSILDVDMSEGGKQDEKTYVLNDNTKVSINAGDLDALTLRVDALETLMRALDADSLEDAIAEMTETQKVIMSTVDVLENVTIAGIIDKSDKMSDNVKTINNSIANINTKMAAIISENKKIVETAKKNTSDILINTALIASNHKELSASIEKHKTEIQTKISTLEKVVTENRTTIENTIEQLKVDLEKSDVTNKEELTKIIKELETTLKTTILNNKTELTTSVKNLDSKVTEIKTEMNTEFTSVREMIKTLETNIKTESSAKTTELINTITELREQTTAAQNEITDMIDKKYIELVSLIESNKSETDTNLQNLDSLINKNKEDIEKALLDSKNELSTSIEDLRGAVDKSSAKNKAELESLISDLESALANLRKDTGDSIADLEERTNKGFLEIKGITNLLEQVLQEEIRSNKDEIDDALSALDLKTSESLANLTDKFNKADDDLRQLITENKLQTDRDILDLNNLVNANKEDIDKALSDESDRLTVLIDELQSVVDANKAELDGTISKVNNLLSDFKIYVEDRLDELMALINKNTENIETNRLKIDSNKLETDGAIEGLDNRLVSLEDQAETVRLANIKIVSAQEFDADIVYSLGDYVLKDGYLCRLIAVTSTQGLFLAEEWEETPDVYIWSFDSDSNLWYVNIIKEAITDDCQIQVNYVNNPSIEPSYYADGATGTLTITTPSPAYVEIGYILIFRNNEYERIDTGMQGMETEEPASEEGGE